MNIKLEKSKIKIIKIGDKDYPQKLLHIYAPPSSLYVIGNEKILNEKSIAIIGCRQCSEYGKKISYKFSKEITKNKINIVSGLARGIDSYAHKGNVDIINNDKKNNKDFGRTIAVLGSGLDVIYPPENIKLYNEIIESGGAIITEYRIRGRTNKMAFSSQK